MNILRSLLLFSSLLALGCASMDGTTMNTKRNVTSFDTADEALAELKSALASEDPERLVEIFGKQSRPVFITGDPVGDKAMMRRFHKKFQERAELVDVISPEYIKEQWLKVRYGAEGWDMYIPLAYRQGKWVYATEIALEAAKRTRRSINEVATLDTLSALVAAQHKYKEEDLNQNGVADFAQKIISSPGKRDGLYWDAEMEGSFSPLEGLVMQALADGYTHEEGQAPTYEGYVYRQLKAQGRGAKGGAKPYMKNGLMVNGFGYVAYPVKWGASGTNTYIVSNSGRIWKKDLGFRTTSIAEDMKTLNRDYTWVRVEYTHTGEDKTRRNLAPVTYSPYSSSSSRH